MKGKNNEDTDHYYVMFCPVNMSFFKTLNFFIQIHLKWKALIQINRNKLKM